MQEFMQRMQMLQQQLELLQHQLNELGQVKEAILANQKTLLPDFKGNLEKRLSSDGNFLHFLQPLQETGLSFDLTGIKVQLILWALRGLMFKVLDTTDQLRLEEFRQKFA